jgi:hypothetical protein
MNDLNVISTIIVIVATAINLYFVYRNWGLAQESHKSKKPVLDIKLETLPPYKDDAHKTILSIKNVGTKETSSDLLVIVSCSWMPSISYKMNFPTDAYRLDPNEEIIWKFRIDEHYTPNSIVAVKITDGGSNIMWDLHEQI